MKAAIIAITAVLAVAMCVSNQTAAPENPDMPTENNTIITGPSYCGLTIVLSNRKPPVY